MINKYGSFEESAPIINRKEKEVESDLNSSEEPENVPNIEFSGDISQDFSKVLNSKSPLVEIDDYVNVLMENANLYFNFDENRSDNFKLVVNNDSNIKILKDSLINFVLKYGNTSSDQNLEEIILGGKTKIDSFFHNLSFAFIRQENHWDTVQKILNESIFQGANVQSCVLKNIHMLEGSDPHLGGKRACILGYRRVVFDPKIICCFPGGQKIIEEEVKVVYKPRSLAVEASMIGKGENPGAFQLINDLIGEPDALPTCLIETFSDEEGEFGFMEWIQQRFRSMQEGEDEIKYESEMKKFGLTRGQADKLYKRIGMLQFAAQLFGITDLNPSNVIVTELRTNEFYMVPIDLETTYDIRVLKKNYPTGLVDGLYLRGIADGNFIVMKNSKISPRGHRINKHDFDCILSGFLEIQKNLSKNIDAVPSLLRFAASANSFQHRYVPVGTSNLSSLINGKTHSDEAYSEQFIELLNQGFSEDIKTNGGVNEIHEKSEEIKREFIKDRQNGDIPIFFIHNENGEVYYNDIRIGRIEGIEEELMQRINLLPQALIDNLFDKSND